MGAIDDGSAELTIAAVRDESGGETVTLRGELDSSNVDTLRPTVEAIAAREPARVTFELGDLRFVDSAGLALLVAVARAVPSVHVRNPTAIVRRVIVATGLSSVLLLDS